MTEYRGKRIDNGEFITGNLIRTTTETWINPIQEIVEPVKMVEVHPATVGQFLHSQDHNGQDEYEGDIVKTDTGVTGVLKLSLQNFHRYEDWDEETKDLYDKKKFPYNYCEIIGTIHDKEQTP